MTEEQEYLFGMMREIDQICRKHGIKYGIMGGTLIGALRHEGFLPWDDDADLFMTHGEFAKFVEACKTDLPANRALQVPGLTLNYTNNFPRYVSTQTTAIHTTQVLSPDDVCGDVIDLFVLDPIADSEEVREAYTRDLMTYADVLSYSACYGRRFGVPAEEIAEAIRLDKEKGRAWTCDYWENRLSSYFDDNGSYYAARWGGIILYYPRWMWDEVMECTFEGESFMAPAHFNEYLRQHYGDEWTNLPPHAERVSHAAAYSLRVPYTEALEYFEPLFDPDLLKEDMQRRSVYEAEVAAEDFAIADADLTLVSCLHRLEMEQVISENKDCFDAALASRDGAALVPFVNDYIAWQCGRNVIGREDWRGAYRMLNPFMGDLTPEERQAVLLALMCTERVGWARRLMEVARCNNVELSEGELFIDATLGLYAKGTDAYWGKRYAESLQIADRLLADWPTHYSFLKLKMNSLLALGGLSQPGFVELLAYCEELFPNDGVFMKWRADILDSEGMSKKADELYAKCVDQTNDGIIHLEVKKKKGYIPTWIKNEFYSDQLQDADAEDEKDCSDGNDAIFAKPSEKKEQLKEGFFKTLSTLSDYCNEHGIEYFLNDFVARAFREFGKLPDNRHRYLLLIKAPEMLRLVEALEQDCPEGYDFEIMSDTNGKPQLYFYDTNTTLYRHGFSTPRKHQCIFVIARMLNSVPYDQMNSLEYACYRRACGMQVSIEEGQEEAAAAYEEQIKNCDLNELGRQELLRRVSLFDPRAERLHVDAPSGRWFSSKTFAETERFEFRGHSFCVPVLYDRFMRRERRMHPDFVEESAFDVPTCASATIPWRDVVQAADIDYSDFAKRRLNHVRRRKPYSQMRKRFLQTFERVKCAVALKEASLDILPLKEQVHALLSWGRKKRALKLLEPYIAVAQKHADRIYLNIDDQMYKDLKTALSRSRNPDHSDLLSRIAAFESKRVEEKKAFEEYRLEHR